MSDTDAPPAARAAAAPEDAGLDAFLRQIADLQTTLEKVAGGMEALGDAALRQGKDTDNLAAHILAIEAVLAVVLRQIPVDPAEVGAEAARRTGALAGDAPVGSDIVADIARGILKRGEEA